MKISFVGLGKLGCCMAAGFASKGFEVIGIDINKDVVEAINKGKSPHYEPGLEELIKKTKIKATTNHKVIADTDVTFIMVPTPSTSEGGFSTEYVETAALEVGRNIPTDKEYHIVVITSTVVPGSINEKIKPILERTTNRKVGINLGLCHVPEFMAIGNVINDFLNPEFVIIGESDEKAGRAVELIYKILLEVYAITPIHHMSLYNAEISKLANNAYVAMKMSFANTVGEICEKMPTGNARQVLEALGSDTRIGNKYLKPGLSFGGPCFGRDSRAFIYAANKYNTRAHLAQMTDVVNIHQIQRIVSKILGILSEKGTNKLSVLGLTYKPDTVLTEDSASLKIIEKLVKEGIQVTVYDPSFSEIMKSGGAVPFFTPARDIKEALLDAEICFIATPWDEFKKLTKADFMLNMKGKPVILDAWGIQKQLQDDTQIDYREIGTHYEKI